MTALDSLDDCANRLLESGPGLVVLKQGAQGVTLYQPGWQHHQDAITLGVLVDSIGAGDAFDASFLYGTLAGWPLEERALFASVAAGYTVTGVGGTNTFPTHAQIKQTMDSYR
jgi:sugar/nucleoside kinase (ribokinase family)